MFLSTLSLRRATRFGRPIDVQLVFLSTLSLRRATCPGRIWSTAFACFYPRSPCGERLYSSSSSTPAVRFYPRSPCGERPWDWFFTGTLDPKFLSTLSLRRATHFDNYNLHCVEVSIHALLAESDQCSLGNPRKKPCRSPQGERG